jgi:FkbM family methyltransferase
MGKTHEIKEMMLLESLRKQLQLRYRIERIWPRFVPLDAGGGIYADRGTRLWVAANPQVYAGLNRFLEKIVTPDASFIDCGANFGWVSIPVAVRLKHGRGVGKVLAIEADPTTARMLAKTLQKNRLSDQVVLARTFVAEQVGVTTFHSCTSSGMSAAFLNEHIHDAVQKYGGTVTTRTVATSSVDNLVALHTIRNVAAIKIDVEGAELPALRGCQNLIRQQPGAVFIVEVNPVTTSAAGYSIRDIWQFFRQQDFQVFTFASDRSQRLIPCPDFDEERLAAAGDIVAVKDDSLLRERLGVALCWD